MPNFIREVAYSINGDRGLTTVDELKKARFFSEPLKILVYKFCQSEY